MRDDRSRSGGEPEHARREPESIGGLPAELEPPGGLEERVVRALRERGLLAAGKAGRPPLGRRPLRLGGAIAAGLALFAAGWLAGRAAPPPGDTTATPGTSTRFLLLLYEGEGFRATEAEIPRLVEEYRAWAAELRGESRLVLAEKLAEDGRLLGGGGEEIVAEALIPRAAAGSITGFYLIRARDYAEAVAIAGRSPHLRYGGSISVRRIDRT